MRTQSIRNRLLKFTVLIPAILALSSGCAVKNEEIIEPAADVTNETTTGQVRKLIQREIKGAGNPPRISFGGKFIYASTMLPRFYERNNYHPVWSDDKGLLPQTNAFISIIRDADKEGLNPADYHLPEIHLALSEIHQHKVVTASNYKTYGESLNPYGLSKTDLLLTDALLKYSSHLLNGRIHPEIVDTAWMIRHREMDLTDVLRSAIETNQIEENLKRLLPENPVYSRLKDALAQYQQIAERGGWPMVPEGSKMEKGHRGDRVLALRARLTASGDLSEEYQQGEYSDLFDKNLAEAVRRFQRRHGLKPDGVVGPSTLAALNVPVQKRINQIELNMERWRWIPQNLGRRYILVNIANYELYVVEDNRTVLKMRVVVGKPYWNTPVFNAEMTYLVLNPYWNIPETIFAEEKLPKIKKDPEYFSKDNIKVLTGWSPNAEAIDPSTIDWSKVTEQNFRYRLRQEPGPGNPLGRIKFMFPNPYHVYLHDTSQKHLFNRVDRNLSHGCIRIEKPYELAEYVLRSDPSWTPERIRKAINKGTTQSVRLPEPIPVYLLYFTAWVDDDGTVEFRDDIYQRDRALEEALRTTPQTFSSAKNAM